MIKLKIKWNLILNQKSRIGITTFEGEIYEVKIMTINLKNGIDQLLFGMKQKDVEAIYGKPNKQFKDEDENVIYLYNEQKFRLTFYEDEDVRVGYSLSCNVDASVLN